MDIVPYLLVAYGTYVVGTASPGPANLAIMATSMEAGRASGVAMALGVVSGSVMWGVVAALGLGALLEASATVLVVMKVMGGLYLLWLAYRAARGALSTAPIEVPAGPARGAPPTLRRHYLRGLGIHLVNPKAVFVWMAIITLGLPVGAPPVLAALIVAGCAALGVVVFVTYALVFSSAPVVRVYAGLRRWIGAVIALFFGAAGTRLLLS
ncbi:LysE family translocator [Salinarimonas rosea]|uniref:LysE family translocator n=1 Tax=Salinarimonas rosea TaxID=552063 RepID=UPI000428BE4B|nr:LysE family translocator [Salinarimonas rosea]